MGFLGSFWLLVYGANNQLCMCVCAYVRITFPKVACAADFKWLVLHSLVLSYFQTDYTPSTIWETELLRVFFFMDCSTFHFHLVRRPCQCFARAITRTWAGQLQILSTPDMVFYENGVSACVVLIFTFVSVHMSIHGVQRINLFIKSPRHMIRIALFSIHSGQSVRKKRIPTH